MYIVLRNTMWISAILASIVATLWIATYIQLKTTDPLNEPGLQKLIRYYTEHPQDQEIKDSVRSLDFLRRQAFFTTKRQIILASYIFAACFLVFLLCAKWLRVLSRSAPKAENTVTTTHPPIAILATLVLYWIVSFICGYSLYPHFSFSPTETITEENALAVETFPAQGNTVNTPAQGNTVVTETSPLQDNTVLVSNTHMQDSVSFSSVSAYPFFRGWFGQGIAYSPHVWKKPPEVLWTTKIPKPGFNSPIMCDATIFLAGADPESKEIYAISSKDGKFLWTYVVGNIPNTPVKLPKVTADTGYAAPTLATNGMLVFALFANGDLVSISRDGKLHWAKNLGMPKNHYGHSSSLIIAKDLLLIQYDHDTETKLIALNLENGNMVWEKTRDVQISWASPMLWKNLENIYIVLTSCPNVICYDISTGTEIWSTSCMGGEVAPSPAYSNGHIFVTNVGQGLIALSSQDGSILWENFDIECPEVASPVATEKFVFLANSYGTIMCFDAQSGKLFWQNETSTGFYASPIVCGNELFCIDKHGHCYMIEIAEEYHQIATWEIGEPVVATPCILDGHMYVRGLEFLYALGSKE